MAAQGEGRRAESHRHRAEGPAEQEGHHPWVHGFARRGRRNPDRASLVARTRALDRALQWNHLVIPHFHIPYARIALWNKFGYPSVTPLQGVQLNAWWIDPDKDAALAGRGRTSGER